MAKKEDLIEVIDPEKIKGKKENQVMEIVLQIHMKDRYESPNSATFSMALDSIVKKGKIFIINKKKKFEEMAELD